jgi:conjugal transfer pilus assembly protein TraW
MLNRFFIVIVTLAFYNAAIAKDFGVQGATFQIKEEGFVAMIKRKLGNINLAEHQNKMQNIARKRVEEPEAVEGISKCQESKVYYFDPSYVLDQDVYLPSGELLHAIGTTVNPLDHMEWRDKLVFIDGNDKAQVDWLRKNYLNNTGSKSKIANDQELIQNQGDQETIELTENKIVLVAGKPLELERETKHKIYFDQFGALTKKFNIKNVPAVVQQEEKQLKITEVYIGKMSK